MTYNLWDHTIAHHPKLQTLLTESINQLRIRPRILQDYKVAQSNNHTIINNAKELENLEREIFGSDSKRATSVDEDLAALELEIFGPNTEGLPNIIQKKQEITLPSEIHLWISRDTTATESALNLLGISKELCPKRIPLAIAHKEEHNLPRYVLTTWNAPRWPQSYQYENDISLDAAVARVGEKNRASEMLLVLINQPLLHHCLIVIWPILTTLQEAEDIIKKHEEVTRIVWLERNEGRVAAFDLQKWNWQGLPKDRMCVAILGAFELVRLASRTESRSPLLSLEMQAEKLLQNSSNYAPMIVIAP
jgi:hypothetical protein